MKLYYKNDKSVGVDEKKEEKRKEEFEKIDEKLKIKRLGVFKATLLGALTAFSLSFQACSSQSVINDGGDAEVDAKNDGDGGVDAGDEVNDDGYDGGDVDADGGVDAGDEIPDGGDEITDGGDEVVDGGDETQDGDGQTCEPKVECNTIGAPETFLLFNVNGEDISETKTVEQCVQTNEDCSTEVVEDAIELTLSRPLTPDEQQIFMNQFVGDSAFGVTTQYDIVNRQFGSLKAYNERLQFRGLIDMFICTRIDVSADGVITATFSGPSATYVVKSTDPPVPAGDNRFIKVYHDANPEDGIPVAVLSDIKLAEHGQAIQLDGVGYYALMEVDPANRSNLAGMRLTTKAPTSCDSRRLCNTKKENSVVLFTVNNEDITETKTAEKCKEITEDCTKINSERLDFALSRPLTPDEQQIFQNQYVMTALGVTTMYNPMAREFGGLVAYNENLHEGESIYVYLCFRILVSPEGIITVNLIPGGAFRSIDPPLPTKFENNFIKVYPDANPGNGVPVAVLSDVKQAENGQTVQLSNGLEYSVTISTEQGNPANLEGMTLYREERSK